MYVHWSCWAYLPLDSTYTCCMSSRVFISALLSDAGAAPAAACELPGGPPSGGVATSLDDRNGTATQPVGWAILYLH